jgi:hypothetical protein
VIPICQQVSLVFLPLNCWNPDWGIPPPPSIQRSIVNFFLIRVVGGGDQGGSTQHDGHWMAYCTCPGWLWWWRIWWNEDLQGKPKYSEKTCPSATLSTTNPTWRDPGSNPGRRGGKPATNRLSYGAAQEMYLLDDSIAYVDTAVTGSAEVRDSLLSIL